MLGFAALNRGLSLRLGAMDDQRALQRLRRNAGAEVAAGVGVIALVGALGVLVPALHEPIVWPFEYTLSFDQMRQSAWLQLGVVAAGASACIAAIALLAGVLARPQRFRLAAATGLVAALVVYVFLLVAPAHPTTYLVSPVPYAAEAIATGSSLYMENCSGCHAPDGRGNASPESPAASAQLDLNEITPERRAGDLFWSIAHGIPASSMPGFAGPLGEADIWSLVQFLDAQTAAQNALTLSDRLHAVKPVPAPEFTFEFPNKSPMSPQESLRQQRGKRIPLLVFYTLPASLPRLLELAALESAYTRAGAVIIAIPMNASPVASLAATSRDLHAGGESILAFTSPAVAATYTMFAREEDDKPVAAVQHVEYLVDRFGSIRARGIGVPAARSKWSVRMLHQISVLVHEPPRPPIQWGHRH